MRRISLLSAGLFVLGLLAGSLAQAGEIAFQAWSYAMPGEEDYYHKLIADFEAAHPGDKVNFQYAKWDDAHDQIAEWLKTGTGPDLVILPDMWIPEFAKGLYPYVDDMSQETLDQFHEVLLDKARYQGHRYGLVWATSTKALFYRTDLFRQAGVTRPPQNWDELLGLACLLKGPYGPYGLGIPAKPTYESTDNWYFFFWSAGGEFFDENGKAAVNSPIGVASLKYYRDFARLYRAAQPEVTSWSRKDLQEAFGQGKLAMHENGPWLVNQARSLNPKLEFALAPLPVAPDRAPFKPRRITQVITDHLMLSRASQQPSLAADFIQFAYQPKYRQAWCELGMVPEMKAVAQSDFFQKNPDWKIFVDIVPEGKSVPLMNWQPIELAAQEMLYKVFSGRQDPKAALDELAAVMDRVKAAGEQPAPVPGG